MTESAFGRHVLLRHGARADLRIWRNATGNYWYGDFVRRESGLVVLANAGKVHVGLPEGSADYVGIGAGGRFISLELKEPGARTKKERLLKQRAWRDMVLKFGGLAAIAENMEQVDALLGAA